MGARSTAGWAGEGSRPAVGRDGRERLPRGRRALTMNNEHERAVPSPLATRPTAMPLNVVALELSLSPSRVFAPCPAPLSISYAKNDMRFFVAMDSITGRKFRSRENRYRSTSPRFIPFVFLRFLLIINRNLFFFNIVPCNNTILF